MKPTTKPSMLRHVDDRLAGLRKARAAEPAPDSGKLIHDIRRTAKEFRALWRLLRPLVEPEIYDEENGRLREAANGISAARDERVIRQTLERLRRRRGRRLGRAYGAALRALKADTAAGEEAPDPMPAIDAAIAALAESRERLAALELQADPAELGAGLGRVYRQARRRRKKAFRRGRDADFHDWRKSVKYLMLQLRLIRKLKVARPSKLIDELRELQRNLGLDHDYVVARERLASLDGRDETMDRVITDLERQSARLRRIMRAPGKRLLRLKPKAFTQRLLARDLD